MFESKTEIYRDRAHLKGDTAPDEIVDRDRVLERFQAALQPVVYGEPPDNVLVYGNPGVGKTTVTRYVLRELRAATDGEVDDVRIQCNRTRGVEDTLAAAADRVTQLTNGDPTSADAIERTREAFDRHDGTILLVFDEIDALSDGEAVLDRLRSIQESEDVRAGYIAICDDLRYTEYLSEPYVEASFESRIRFPGYDSEVLRSILRAHVDVAFEDGVVREEALSRCVAYAVQEGGNCRAALDLLRQAGDQARSQGANRVSREHVDAVRERQVEERFITKIVTVREQKKMVLYALVTLDATESLPARSRTIYERYTDLCATGNYDPLTIRTVRKFLADFAAENIVSAEEHHTPDGNYREYVLNPHLDLLVEALREFLLDVGVHDSVRHLLDHEPYHEQREALPSHVFRTHRNE